MAVYAIGDLQGCHDDFRRLLDQCRFDPARDRLWLVGDLISRGPDSLGTLRHVVSLGEAVVSVLGNHDLHMLAVDAGGKSTRDPDLQAILDAPDREQLLGWLRHRPLLHHDAELGYTLVHAGIYPFWDLQQAMSCAGELQDVLRGAHYRDFFERMYGDKPVVWSEDLQGWERLRFICNSFSRMRFCSPAGELCLKAKGPPGTQPEGFQPWYLVEGRKTRDQRIIFGHWSTLGRQQVENVYALDTGCIWGGELTALQIDCAEPRYISVSCPEHRQGKLE